MPIVQPGQVPTYTPSPTSLTGYDDSDRTRFLFNGSQLMKARLALARPAFAYVGYFGESLDETSVYKNYKTLDGKYALVNGDRETPVAIGYPGAGEFVLVGFDVSVTVSEIVLWRSSHFEFYDLYKVEYTYDDPDAVADPFYFDAAVSNVVETFDFGENKYKYTITLGSSYTAKYFRIHASYMTLTTSSYTAGGATLNVTATAGFPSSLITSLITVDNINGWTDSFVYTGKTGSSLTGVAGITEDVASGSEVRFIPPAAEDATEVEIGDSYEPLLEFWDLGGTPATPQSLTDDFYYDIVYDKHFDKYFVMRFNEEETGTAGVGFDPDDDFNDTGVGFNTSRWEESTSEPNFQHNTSSGTLDYLNGNDAGRLTTKYYMDGDFTAQIDVGFNDVTSSGANVSIRALDYENNNAFVQMGFHGPWCYSGAKDGNWEAVHIRIITDTTGGTAEIHNLRIDTGVLPDGSMQYTLTYDSANDFWTVVDSLAISYVNATPGVDYSDGPLTFTIVHTGSPSNGAQFVLDTNNQHYALPADTAWDWKLGLEKSSNSYICKYDEGVGFIDLATFTNTNGFGAKIEIYADGNSDSVDIAMDNFDVTGSIVFPSINVFSIEAVDGIGNVTTISGLTDDEGFLIKRFDVINEDLDYNSFIGGRVQLATDGLSNGSLYVKVKGNLYEYTKASLPLDLENGSSANNYKQGVIPELTAESFAFNSYSNAGLCYVEYDGDRAGTYLKTISTSTLSGTEYEAFLDVSTANYPFAWHINNYTVMYYVDGTALKEYDMDKNDVAFCNVVADDKIMSAGTSTTTDVTATVLNVYGEPLSAKSVTFVVSGGAGAVSPGSDCTNASGIAETTYTVGDTVGTTTITSTASDAAC